MKTALILLLLSMAVTAYCQEYCSLIVNAVDPNGEQVHQGHVVVEEQNGRNISAEYRPGGLRFCDLGITPVTITIGTPVCNQVTVRNVGLTWGKTVVVKVIYDGEACRHDPGPAAACEILFRFADHEGDWIPGVSLSPSVDLTRPKESDTYGRLLINIVAGKEIKSMTQSSGYLPKEIHLTCARDLLRSERVITLDRKK